MYKNMNINNNNIEIQRQESMKRRSWHDSFYTRLLTTTCTPSTSSPPPLFMAAASKVHRHHHHHHLTRLDGLDLVPNVPPSVTVVLEGRSICHRVNLHKHSNYQSLAKALRQMFAHTLLLNNVNNDHVVVNEGDDKNNNNNIGGGQLDLSNALPGHIVAYEDLENDLLLAGDLQSKDFVRVAKRIRILPIKPRTIKPRTTIKNQ